MEGLTRGPRRTQRRPTGGRLRWLGGCAAAASQRRAAARPTLSGGAPLSTVGHGSLRGGGAPRRAAQRRTRGRCTAAAPRRGVAHVPYGGGAGGVSVDLPLGGGFWRNVRRRSVPAATRAARSRRARAEQAARLSRADGGRAGQPGLLPLSYLRPRPSRSARHHRHAYIRDRRGRRTADGGHLVRLSDCDLCSPIQCRRYSRRLHTGITHRNTFANLGRAPLSAQWLVRAGAQGALRERSACRQWRSRRTKRRTSACPWRLAVPTRPSRRTGLLLTRGTRPLQATSRWQGTLSFRCACCHALALPFPESA